MDEKILKYLDKEFLFKFWIYDQILKFITIQGTSALRPAAVERDNLFMAMAFPPKFPGNANPLL